MPRWWWLKTCTTDWGMLVTSPNEAPKLVAPLANEAVRNWVPELSVLERDERRRGLLDDLSTLYVALTRARQGLDTLTSTNHVGFRCVADLPAPAAK